MSRDIDPELAGIDFALGRPAPDAMREGWQWLGHPLEADAPDWVAEATEPTATGLAMPTLTGGLTVRTSRGNQRAHKRDWIARIDGEIYLFSESAWIAISSTPVPSGERQGACPSCGRVDPEIIVSNVTGRNGFQRALKCRSCDMQTDWYGSKQAALEEWALLRSSRAGGDGPRPRECKLTDMPVGDVLDHEAAYDLFEALRNATANTWHEIAARHLAYHRNRAAPPQPAPDAMREEIAIILLHMNALDVWKPTLLWARDMVIRRRDQHHTNDCEGHSCGCVRCHIDHAFACADAILSALSSAPVPSDEGSGEVVGHMRDSS